MLHIIIIIVCDKHTPNTSEVTCNFCKLFVTFGLDTLYVVWMLIEKNTPKLYVPHQLLFVLLFSMLISPTFRWVFIYEINNYPRLEFVKFVIFCYCGNDWYASNKDIFIGAISLYSGVAWSQGWSLPSIGVVIMLNCCFSKSICMFSTMIKFCITKTKIFSNIISQYYD